MSACEDLVNALQGLPGVRLPGRARQEHTSAAQEALGVRLPEDLRLLGCLTDGLSIKHGLLQLLPFDPSSPLSIERFNDPTTWQWAYARINPEILDFVYFGFSWTGAVHGYRRKDLAGPHYQHARTYVVVPRAPGGVFPSAPSVVQGLLTRTEQLRRTGRLALHPDDAQVVHMHGPLPPGKIVMPGPRDLIEDDGSLEGSYPMETVTGLIAIGELTTQLREMPPGTQIVAVEPWVDELGRSRLRWRTARPH